MLCEVEFYKILLKYHCIVVLMLFLDGVHGKFSNIFLRVKDDDVEFGTVETKQSHIRAQADGHTECGELYLKYYYSVILSRLYQ